MAEQKFNNKENSFNLVGTLKSAEVKERVSVKNGKTYISADVVVESVLNGEVNSFDVRFFCARETAEGKPSTLFDTYSKLETLVNKKVSLSGGSIRENRFWSDKSEQMVSKYELSGRFIEGVSDMTADEATFKVSGFIAATLTEKTNKENEVYRYDLKVAQPGYNENAVMTILNLNVDPEDRDLVRALSSLDLMTTVSLCGNLSSITKVTTREKTFGFGKPVTETFVNQIKGYYITAGDVIEGENAFSAEDCANYIENYKANDLEIASKEATSSKKNTSNTPAEARRTPTKRQQSLI